MEIIFAGGSHYDTYGLKSIQKIFDKVYLLNQNDEGHKSLLRENDELISDFFDVDCPYVFLCGYSRFIREEELEKKRFINVHGALLPKYRGMHSSFYAIMNGEKELGITFHLVDKYMDAGDILGQFKFEYKNQTIDEINCKIDELVEKYAGTICYKYINGEIVGIKQDINKVSFGAKRNLDDCYIDFQMSNELLKRFFKALTPSYPRPMINIRGKRYEVIGNYEIKDCNYYGPVGRAVNISDSGVWIKTCEGFLIISEVQEYETKKIFRASDLIPIGYRFIT